MMCLRLSGYIFQMESLLIYMKIKIQKNMV